MDIDFKNKNVLITGASRGLGFDLTKKYLDYGANVISVSRSGIQKINSKHMHLKLDLEKKFSKEKLLLFFKKKKTYPDILINNLGGDLKNKNPLMNYSSFEKILRLNFGIGVELVNLLTPHMKKKNYGRICFISSISGLENQGSPAYCASKAAINAYVRCIGRFLIKYKIVVTNVMPGAFFTKKGYWDKLKKNERKKYNNFIKKRISIERLASLEEISNCVIFMTSEHTSFSAGSSFLVDGGQGKILKTY